MLFEQDMIICDLGAWFTGDRAIIDQSMRRDEHLCLAAAEFDHRACDQHPMLGRNAQRPPVTKDARLKTDRRSV